MASRRSHAGARTCHAFCGEKTIGWNPGNFGTGFVPVPGQGQDRGVVAEGVAIVRVEARRRAAAAFVAEEMGDGRKLSDEGPGFFHFVQAKRNDKSVIHESFGCHAVLVDYFGWSGSSE